MNKLVCEMCSSNELIKQDGVFVCQSCGCKYTVEEAKKLMIEGTVNVTGTVKIDSSDELQNLYELARRAKNEENSENAQKYYEQILVKDPSSWEANFYNTYFQSMNCKIAEIMLCAQRMISCADSAFELIKNNITDEVEQRKAVTEVAEKLGHIAAVLFFAKKRNYDSIDPQIKANFVQDYANAGSKCRDICYLSGDKIISVFGEKYADISTNLWKSGVYYHNILNGVFSDKYANAEIIRKYNNKIKEYNPDYEPPETNMKQDGGCYIATAVYGSYDCPEVWTLRRFRDFSLSKSWYGRTFIRTYYAISPKLVKMFGNKKWFVNMWKKKLDSMIIRLQKDGFESTPYDDMKW